MNSQQRAAMQMALAIALMFLVAGCSDAPAMTNKEIVEQTKLCNSNGLDATALRRSMFSNMDIIKIVCEPRYLKCTTVKP